ncbi:MAG: histidinol-phosphate transaminase [Chloroflexota bacterium]
MPLQPRREIRKIATCPHGGPNADELRTLSLTPEQVLDFSVCCNPFPPPPGMREALPDIDISRYPDSEATELKEALSKKLGVPPANVLVGNGTTELIRLIALAYFEPGDKVLILKPTYGEYEPAARLMGADVVEQWGKEADGFQLKTAETASLIQHYQPKAVFICNPNNPTGQYFSRREIETVLAGSKDSLIVLDEAYIAFVERAWSSLGLIERENVIILRSMTKDYALAGLRLGYAVAHQKILDNLRRVRPPWNVNAIAQKAGVIALSQSNYLKDCQQRVREAKKFLVDEFTRLGFTLVPSRANFFLMKVGHATRFRTTLLRQGIMVRDCTSFGLPEYVRIGPRTLPECRQLVSAIRSLRR